MRVQIDPIYGLRQTGRGLSCRGQLSHRGPSGQRLTGLTAQEWETALTSLRDDPAFRHRLGCEARLKVENEYSLQVTAPRMLELFREAARQ